MTTEARIEISTLCNYKCSFCPHSELNRKKETMSMNLFIDIIAKLPEHITTITLSGLGEAFLDTDIFDKIYYAKKMGYIVNILTNGSQLNQIKTLKITNLKVDSLRISIHSTDIKKYKEITGSSDEDYYTVMNSIRILNEFPNDVKVIVTVDMIEENTDEVNNIIKKIEPLVDLLEIWKVHNWGSRFDYRKGKKVKSTCGRPFNGPLQIQVDGTVNMCCFDYDGELLLGDLKTQTIDEIFEGSMYKVIVDYHKGINSYADLLCHKCDQLYEKDESILIYNSKFGKERIGKTSTTYEDME